MLNRIPISFFQICAILLFIIYLGMKPIFEFLLTNSLTQILFRIIFILLNPIVFLGYYKISQEQDKKLLSSSSVVLAIALFVYYFYNNFVIATLEIEIINIRDPLFVISNTILGLTTIYFSIILFINKTLNNRNLIGYAVISLLTGILLCSYYFTELAFFTRWIFFAMTAIYLFPRKKEEVLLNK